MHWTSCHLQHMYEFKTGTSEFKKCHFSFVISRNPIVFAPSPKLHSSSLGHPVTLCLCHVKLVDVYSAWKRGEKQLLSHMVAAVLVFLGPVHTGEHLPVLSVLITTISGGLSEICSPTAESMSHAHSPSEAISAAGLCHTIPSGRNRHLPRCHHFYSTTQSSSLRLCDKPCNSQWATPGMEMGKGTVNTSYSFFKWISHSYISLHSGSAFYIRWSVDYSYPYAASSGSFCICIY